MSWQRCDDTPITPQPPCLMGHPPMHQEETLLRRWLLDAIPILRTQDIPTTMLCAAMAGLCGLGIHLIPVVVGEFLPCLDILDCHKPDGIAKLFCVAVWVTRMINIACRILARAPIKGIALVQADKYETFPAAKRRSLSSLVIFSPMYRIILVPCLISCPANSPCPAILEVPTRTRIFTRGCLLVCADVLPGLSSLDSSAPNIGAHMKTTHGFSCGSGPARVSGGMAPGLRRVYSLLLLLSPQVSAHCCCPSLRILVVYICVRNNKHSFTITV